MKIGVYRITNKINGKVYIGKSIDLEFRLKAHKSAMRRGEPKGASNKQLVIDCGECGIENFDFEILHEVPADDFEEMSRLEIQEILRHQSMNPEKGYNRSVSPHSNKEFILQKRHEKNFRMMNQKLSLRMRGSSQYTIEQYDLEGNLIKVWPSLKHLLEGFGQKIDRQGVHRASKGSNKSGKRPVYKNFHWTMTLK